MSEAMTNSEIEDVLTSIRRLVALEDKRPQESGRLILTEELRVGIPAAIDAIDGAAVQVADVADSVDGTVAEPEAHSDAGAVGDVVLKTAFPEPDFGKLEATIAELEAAVSASGEPWEPEAVTDDAPRPSNVTDLYGRLSFAHRTEPTDAVEVVESETDGDMPPEPMLEADAEADADFDADPGLEVEAVQRPVDAEKGGDMTADAEPQVEPNDDEVLDEDMLRALVAQIVREELHGQLGERVTQQVRKLVRAEIAKALDERKYL